MNEVNENVTVNGARTRYEEFAANRSAYEYTAEQVEAMFGALEKR